MLTFLAFCTVNSLQLSMRVLQEFIQQVATSPLQMDKERQASGPKDNRDGSMRPGKWARKSHDEIAFSHM